MAYPHRIKFDLKQQMDKITDKMIKEAQKRVMAAANVIMNEAKLGMADGPQTGLIYRIPGTQKTYRASAPGEFPAVRTGRLRSSIRTKLMPVTKRSVKAVIGSVLYGKFLEEGTDSMEARPWLTMASLRAHGRVQQILAGKWFRPIDNPDAKDKS